MLNNFFLFPPSPFFSQDDRSPLSSGESSDESSSVEVAGPSHHIQEQIVRRQRQSQQQQQQQQPTSATKKQESQQPTQQIQARDELGKAFGNSSSLNSLICPQALANLPQEVLMNLVQSGHIQVGGEGKIFQSIWFHFFRSSLCLICIVWLIFRYFRFRWHTLNPTWCSQWIIHHFLLVATTNKLTMWLKWNRIVRHLRYDELKKMPAT